MNDILVWYLGLFSTFLVIYSQFNNLSSELTSVQKARDVIPGKVNTNMEAFTQSLVWLKSISFFKQIAFSPLISFLTFLRKKISRIKF